MTYRNLRHFWCAPATRRHDISTSLVLKTRWRGNEARFVGGVIKLKSKLRRSIGDIASHRWFSVRIQHVVAGNERGTEQSLGVYGSSDVPLTINWYKLP